MNDYLEKNGWIVIRFWGNEILKNVNKCADTVLKLDIY